MQPPIAMQWEFYKHYIQPYLRVDPNEEYMGYLLSKGWDGWAAGVKPESLLQMQLVEWVCTQLQQKNGSEFAELVSRLMEEIHDAATRIGSISQIQAGQRKEGATAGIYTSMLDTYKTLFESEFRLWVTVPFFFAHKMGLIAADATTPASFLYVGASEKYHALKGVKTAMPKGNLADLVAPFDNNIRNAGSGHCTWEVTDKGTLLLKFMNPKTGLPKGAGELELTEQELRDLIRGCKRAVWVLEVGVALFIVNNPAFQTQMLRAKTWKASEIHAHLASFAEERWLTVPEFHLSDDRKQLKLSLQRDVHAHEGTKPTAWMGGRKYEIAQKSITESYRTMVLTVLYKLMTFFAPEAIPEVHLKIFNQKADCIGDLVYKPEELRKLHCGPYEENVPTPHSGTLPDLPFERVLEMAVEPGTRDEFEKILEPLPTKMVLKMSDPTNGILHG